MTKILIFFSATIFFSCAGTLTHVHMLQDGGAIRAEDVTGEDYQYKIFIKNTSDFGWNGDRAEDRKKAVELLLKSKCKETKIIEDLPIQTGTYAFGRPAITWISKVKCVK